MEKKRVLTSMYCSAWIVCLLSNNVSGLPSMLPQIFHQSNLSHEDHSHRILSVLLALFLSVVYV